MSQSQEFTAACRSDLEQIDDLLNRVSRDLEALRAARPVDMPTLGEQLREAESRAADLRERVKRAALWLWESAAPEWSDRVGLDRLIADLAAQLNDRELEQPRRQLQRLTAELDQSRVINRRTGAVSASLDVLRVRARDELTRATETVPPPPLPGPAEGELWLAWAWQQEGDTLSGLLTSLRPGFPALAQFIEEVEVGQWSSMPLAPASSSKVAPPAAPVMDDWRGGGPSTTSPVPAPVVSPPLSILSTPAQSPADVKPLPPAAPVNSPTNQNPPLPAVIPAPQPAIEVPLFPDHLKDFQAFTRAWWLSPAQRCEPAPWSEPGFADQLDLAAEDALGQQRLERLSVFCRAAAELVHPGGIRLPQGAGFRPLGPNFLFYTLSGLPVNVHLKGLARVRLK